MDQLDAFLSIVNWNVQWKLPHTAVGATIKQRIFAWAPEIVCLTEGFADFFDGVGHVITSEADYGYPLKPGRRKVLLWSRQPWRGADHFGDPDLPGGRYVAGRTTTSQGEIEVIGVCVPWKDAHVRTGRKDRTTWEDHLRYLVALGSLLATRTTRTLIVGDFNQRLPRRREPKPIHNALRASLLDSMRVATEGALPPNGLYTVDHVAHTPDIEPGEASSIPNDGPSGRPLSDHFGVHVMLRVHP